MTAREKQVGGDHYLRFEPQPMEWCIRNGIPAAESAVIWYVVRWMEKGGLQDIDKAIHILELLREEAVAGRVPGFHKPAAPTDETITNLDEVRDRLWMGETLWDKDGCEWHLVSGHWTF